jgi:hypothetical protein
LLSISDGAAFKVRSPVDPLIARYRREPWTERPRPIVSVSLLVNGDKTILGGIVDHRGGEPTGIVTPQPKARLLQQSLITARIARLRRGHQ